jgi:hypothetical protein
MAVVNELYSVDSRRPGILRARAASSPYVFSGLRKCALCGASVTIVSGCSRNRTDVRYGCSMHYNRGRGACENNLLIARRALEEQLLAGPTGESVASGRDRIHASLFRGRVAPRGRSPRRRSRNASQAGDRDREKIGNLTRALADGYSPAITADLPQLEEQLAEIRQRTAASRPDAVQVRMRDTRRFVESRLSNLQSVFASEPVTIRAEIAKHVQKITLTPAGRTYVAAGGGICSGAWRHGWCRGPESNWLRPPFQGGALPLSYPGSRTNLSILESALRRVKY